MTGKGVSREGRRGWGWPDTSCLRSVKEQRMISCQETLLVQGWEVAMRTAEGCEFLSGFVLLSHCCREETSTTKPNRNCKDWQRISPTPVLTTKLSAGIRQTQDNHPVPSLNEGVFLSSLRPLLSLLTPSSPPLLFFCSSSLFISL